MSHCGCERTPGDGARQVPWGDQLVDDIDGTTDDRMSVMIQERAIPNGWVRGAVWSLFGLVVTVWLAAIAVAVPRITNPLDPGDVLWGLSFVVLADLGRFIVARRHNDTFGWLLLGGPLALGVGVLGDDYTGRVLEGAGWPAADWVAMIGNVAFATGAGAIAIALYRFPDGRPVSRTWQAAERLTIVGTVFAGLAGLTIPVVADEPSTLANPLVGDTLAVLSRWLEPASGLVVLGGLLSIASLVARYRRGGPQVRAQLRWVLFPVAVGVFLLLFSAVVFALTPWQPTDGWGIAATVIFTLGVPLGVVAAITRARLYEIDRIISRTVIYGLVTAVLVGVYALVAVVPAALFDLQSDLLVAGATLMAAAAFGPVRRQVQRLVDLRFNRTRYDAAQVADAFAARLRNEVDLTDLTDDLRNVVATTVQPKTVSLWLRRPS